MKKANYIILFITAITFHVHSQEIPTPDYSSRPYILKPDNTLENLERADANSDMKMKGLYGGVEMYFAAFGTTSSLRFNQNNLPRIIIRLENNVDPEESITLSKAEIKKDRRRFLMGSRSMTGAARNTDQVEIKLRFKKIRDGIHEILLPDNLAPGEYAFMPMGDQSVSITSVTNIKISCFGVNGQDGLAPSAQPQSGPKDPLGQAIHQKIQEDKAKREAITEQNNKAISADATTLSSQEQTFIANQKPITPTEQQRSSSLGTQPALVIDLPNAILKDLEKQLEKQLSSTAKPKVTKQGNEIIYSGVINPTIAPEPYNLIAQFTENPGSIQLCAFFHLGGIDFINPTTTQQNQEAKQWLQNFAKQITQTNFQRELDAENKILKKLNSELQSLVEDENKALGKVAKARTDSTNKEASLRQNLKDQDLKKLQITQKKEVMDKLAGTQSPELQAATDAHKEYTTAFIKLKKDNTSMHTDIEDDKVIIRDEENRAALLREQQQTKRQEIITQKDNVRKWQLKIIALNQ